MRWHDDYLGELPMYAYMQPWAHDPIRIVGPVMTRAECACGWVGPDRTGDDHATGLVVDDAMWHIDEVGARL